MKTLICRLCFLFSVLLCSSAAMADVTATLVGSGKTVDAVKAFNRAVAANNGTVDGNSVTEYSSAGKFDAYQAKLYAEADGGKINVQIKVKRETPELFSAITGTTSNIEMGIATKLYESMKRAGYHD